MGFFDFLKGLEEKTLAGQALRKEEAGKKRALQEEQMVFEKRLAAYKLEEPQLQRIISESVGIIENARSLKVALGRFDTLRNSYGRLLALDPNNTPVTISVGKWAVCTAATHEEIMRCLEKAKKDYSHEFSPGKPDRQ